MDDLDTF